MSSAVAHSAMPAPGSGSAASTPYAMMADTRSELVEAVAQFDRMIAQLTGMRAEAIEQARAWSEVTEGAASGTENYMARRSLVAELACAMRMPERTAEALLNDSQALANELPTTLEALRSGSIGYRHAQVMVDHAAPLEAALRTQLEEAGLRLARTTTPSTLNRKLRALRERLDPDSSIERHEVAVADRRVECTGGKDGMAWLSAYLPVEQAVAIYSRITETARSLQCAEEARTLTQLRADLLATVLLGEGRTLGDGAGRTDVDGTGVGGTGVGSTAVRADHPIETFRRIRPRVMVTVPVLTLLGGDEPATLEGHGPIDPATARRLTAEAPSLTRLLTHPETGAVLSVGRDSYRVPARLRSWLRARDGTCRFPNCGRAAANCDLDHTVDWQYGGPTDWSNLAHLCPKHHKLKHEGGWRVQQTGRTETGEPENRGTKTGRTKTGEPGTLTWTSPAGRRYITEPEADPG